MADSTMPIDIDACRRILVVSPHLDDGVLSAGGIIERAVVKGADVVVATAFTADAPAAGPLSALAVDLHALWGLGSAPYAHRRQEDIGSVSMLGARVLHGQLLDALYRTDLANEPIYAAREAIFSTPSERDGIGEALYHLLDGWIAELAPDLILSPLGVGRHVDHIQTSRALQRLAAARPLTVALYEDMPYATGLFPEGSPDTVEAALKRTAWQVVEPQVISVELPGKLAAIGAYASQLADIFPNGLQFGSVVDRYMRRDDGSFAERIWHATP